MTRRSGWITGMACAGVLALGLATAVSAQETTGSISGTITDPTGALIKGAKVTLTNTDRGDVERRLTTNSAGFYTATALPLGTYSVMVEDSGFETEVVTSLGAARQ